MKIEIHGTSLEVLEHPSLGVGDSSKTQMEILNEKGYLDDEIYLAYKTEWLNRLRIERNARLKNSDWTQMFDSPLNKIERTRWRIYRKILRDMPASTEDLYSPSWPIIPEQ